MGLFRMESNRIESNGIENACSENSHNLFYQNGKLIFPSVLVLHWNNALYLPIPFRVRNEHLQFIVIIIFWTLSSKRTRSMGKWWRTVLSDLLNSLVSIEIKTHTPGKWSGAECSMTLQCIYVLLLQPRDTLITTTHHWRHHPSIDSYIISLKFWKCHEHDKRFSHFPFN